MRVSTESTPGLLPSSSRTEAQRCELGRGCETLVTYPWRQDNSYSYAQDHSTNTDQSKAQQDSCTTSVDSAELHV